MPQTDSPQLRMCAAFVVSLYAGILLGGALFLHSAPCAHTSRPHCTLCACVNSAPLIVDVAAPSPEFDDAGEIAPTCDQLVGALAGSDTASRAPPAVATVVA